MFPKVALTSKIRALSLVTVASAILFSISEGKMVEDNTFRSVSYKSPKMDSKRAWSPSPNAGRTGEVKCGLSEDIFIRKHAAETERYVSQQ